MRLDGTASLGAGSRLVSYVWMEGAAQLAAGATAAAFLPLGTHTVTLIVTDSLGRTARSDVVIRVVDTVPPVLSFALNVTRLWPPNHAMQQVASGISASDACDGAVLVSVSVSSNQPVNGLGDGNTSSDWIVTRHADGTVDVSVRAERSGVLTDRIYTITASASDGSGNRRAASGVVVVPHNP